MQYRSLDKSEKWLLWAVGIMMQFFIYVINLLLPNNYTIEHQGLAEQISIHLLGSSFEMFFMTAVIIGLILRGNQQSFYHKKVSGMQSGMITLMADIVENRDDNTGGHIKRTARYVEGIAKELIRRGVYKDILTDEYMQDLIVAAPLHDIGKIHVPDAVLNKPGKLTNDEFDIMKAHTTTGEKLLDHAKEELGEYNYLTIAVEMATYHHEWWNGKGYPYGISGEEIPLCARIMAVADVFDALISKRVYKDPMPLEKAYAIIREESGTHFEPQIVDAFFAVVDDMIVEE
ncbi:MAG: HD domain-containing protein [Lachnospiraceae bacterium]|nr:HD domain-containing protein [Lachnospiraceae bacterium]